MATITGRSSSASTTNTTSYASSAFTPAVGDLLVFLVLASETVDAGSVSSSAGYTFTKVATAHRNSTDTLYVFVADSLVTSAVSQTLTYNCASDAATGCFRVVISISGMARTGASAVRQSAVQNTGTAGTTPAVTFGGAALTANPLVALLCNQANPATVTQPSGWSEQNDSGFNTPTTGFEYANINSGFTSSTVTWGSTSGTQFAALAVEFDTGPVDQALAPPLLSNGNAFYGPTITPGAVALTPARFDNTSAFYAPTVSAAGPVQNLTAPLLSNASVFYAPTVTRGAVTLSPARFDNSQSFFSPSISLRLAPNLFTNANAFYAPTVTPGAVSLSPARFDNTNTFFSPTVSAGQQLAPARLDNVSQFFTPAVTPGAVALAPARFDNGNAFFAPTVSVGPLTLQPPLAVNDQQFFSPAVTVGAVTLNPARFNNVSLFYGPTVYLDGAELATGDHVYTRRRRRM